MFKEDMCKFFNFFRQPRNSENRTERVTKTTFNTNQNKSKRRFLRKYISVVAVLLFICGFGWAVDYTWTGNVSTDWNAAGNWKTSTANPAQTIPTSSDNVTIPKLTTTTNYPETETIINLAPGSSLTIKEGASVKASEITSNGLISNNGTIDVKKLTISSNKLTNNGIVLAKEAIENNGTITNIEGATLKTKSITNGETIDNSGVITDINDNNLELSIINNNIFKNNNTGKIFAKSITNTFGFSNEGSIKTNTLTNTSGTFTNNGGSINSGSITNNAGITNTNNGKIKNTGTITNNSGTITNNGGGTIDSTTIDNESGATVDNDGKLKSDNINNNGGTIDNTDGSIVSDNVTGTEIQGNPSTPTVPASETLTTDQSVDYNTITDFGNYKKIILTGSNKQEITLDPNTQFPEIVIEKEGGSVEFINSLNLKTLTYTYSNTVETEIPITFKGGTVDTTTITTTDHLNLNFTADTTITNGLTHTAGQTTVAGTLSTSSVELGATNKAVNISGTITSTGNQKYNGPVTLSGDTTLNTLAPSDITFESTIEGSNSLTIQNAENVNINGGSITGSANFTSTGKLTFSTAEFSADSITHTTGTTEINAKLTAPTINLGTTTLKADLKATTALTIGDTTVTGTPTITPPATADFELPSGKKITINADSLTINGNFVNKGTVEGAGKLIAQGNLDDSAGTISCSFELNGTGRQDFTPNSNKYKIITINNTSTGPVNVKKHLKAQKINTNCPIVFAEGAEIEENFEIPFGSTVTVTVTTGSFVVQNLINNGEFDFSGTLDIKGDFIDNGTITTPASLTIDLAGTVPQIFTPSSSQTTPFKKVVISNTTGPITFNENFNTKILTDNGNKVPITFNGKGTITDDTTLNTTGKVSFQNDGANPFTFTGAFTHIAGETEIKGTLNAKSVTLGSTNKKVAISGKVDTTASDGAQTYEGPITLSGHTTLTGGAITLSDNISGGFTLTINNSGLLTFNDIKGSTDTLNKAAVGSFLQTGSEKINIAGDINTTKGDISFNSEINLIGDVALSSSKDIIFSEVIKGANKLSIEAATTTTFTKNIGETTSLASLSVKSGTINLPASVTTTNKQSYTGAITIKATTTLTATNGSPDNEIIKLDGAISPETGSLKFNVAKGIINITNSINLAGLSDTTGNACSINLKKGGTISSATTLNTSGKITFGSVPGDKTTFGTAGPTTPTYYDFTHKNGPTEIKGKLFANKLTLGTTSLITGTHVKANSISIEGSSNLTIPEGTTVEITTNFENKGTIQSDGTLKVGGIFTNTNTGSYGPITTTGSRTDIIELNGSGDQTFTPKSSDSYNTITISNKSTDPTTNSVIFAGPIRAKTINCENTAKSNIKFNDTLSTDSFTDKNTVGNITFAKGCTISNDTNFATKGTVTFGTSGETAPSETKIGSTDYKKLSHSNGKTIIYGNLHTAELNLEETEITGTVNGSVISLGKTTLNGNIKGTSFTAGDADNPITFNGDSTSVTTSGPQAYNGSVNINVTTTLESEKNGITFSKSVLGTGKTLNLKVPTSNQNITFSDTVTLGTITDTDTNANITFTKGCTIENATSFATKGTVTFGTSVETTPSETKIGSTDYKKLSHTVGKTIIYGNLTAADLSLGETEITGTVNGAIISLGKTTLNGTIKGTSLTAGNADNPIIFEGDSTSIETSSIQLYNGAVTLSGNTTLNTTAPSDITFSSTIDGTNNLTITKAANILFKNSITNSGNFTVSEAKEVKFTSDIGNSTEATKSPAEINIKATDNILLPANVTTTNDQTYDGPVTIQQTKTTLKTPETINFESTIKGQNNLIIGDSATGTVTNPNIVNIKGGIGDITKAEDTPTSLEINSTTINVTASNITTSGAQTYNGKVESSSDVNIAATSNVLIKFTEPVSFKKLTDTGNNAAITFAKGGNITNSDGTILTTPGIVTFGTYGENPLSTMLFGTSESSPADFTHTAGETIINGKLIANKLTLGATTLLNPGCHVKVNVADIGQSTTNILKIPAKTTFEITTNFTNTGTIENAGTLIVGGNYKNDGIYHNGNKNIAGTYEGEGVVELNGKRDQSFTPNADDSYHTITVTNQGGNTKTVTFKSHLEITQFNDKKTDTSSGTTTEITANCNITFEKGCSINNATELYTPGTVTFGTLGESTASETTIGSDTPYANLTHTAGNTIIYGKLYTADLTLGDTTLKGEINATSSSIGKTNIEGSVKTKNGQIFTGTLNLTGTTTLKSTDSTDGGIEIKGAVSETGDQTLNIQAASGKEIKFVSTVNVETINDSDTTTNEANINFASDVTTKTDIKFLTPGEIIINGTFNTTNKNFEHTTGKTIIETPKGHLNTGKGTVTLGESLIKNKISASSATFGSVDKSITFGNTDGTGTPSVETTGSQTYSGTVALNAANTTIKSTSNGNISFEKTVSGKKLTISTPTTNNSITFTGNTTITGIDDTNNKGKIIFGGTTAIKSPADFKTPNDITFAKTCNITDDSTGKPANITHITNSGKTIIQKTLTAAKVQLAATDISGSISSTDEQTYQGQFTVLGSSTLTISTEEPIIKFTDASSITLNNSLSLSNNTLYQGGDITGIGSISASGKDFVIQPLASPSPAPSIGSQISANRILIDNSKQNITLSNILKATSDLALFGSSYCTTDQESGFTDIYTYNFNSSILGTISSTTPSTPSLKFILDNGTLSAKETLFINGIKVTGTGTLKLPDNYNNTTNKAEAFYSDFSDTTEITITNYTTTVTNSAKLVTEKCNLKTEQTFDAGWDSDTASPFEIVEAHTIDDNVICVKFNRPLRFVYNGNNGLVKGINKITYDKDGIETPYNKTFFKKTTDNPFAAITPIENNGTSYNINIDTIYLAAPDTWNTDATGTSAGVGTDKSGIHKTNIIPHLNIPRNKTGTGGFSYFITDLYGKRLTHYSNQGNGTKIYDTNHEITPPTGTPYTPEYDQCAPVLVSVSTGQEVHDTDPSKWQSYDAHNFIEFRYSEPVTFGDYADLNPDIKAVSYSFEKAQNITHTEANFGEIKNNPGITITGLGSIASGNINTGLQSTGAQDLSINTLYRKDPYSIRISIAGKTSGTTPDLTWDGFINPDTKQPSGTVTVDVENSPIKDIAINKQNKLNNINIKLSGNSLTSETISHTIKNPTSKPTGCSESDFYTYSNWDLSAPELAPINIPDSSNHWQPNPGDQFEILGYNNGTGSVQRIEFHLFDNIHNNDYYWHSTNGWFKYGESGLYKSSADIYGGSRPFADKEKGQTTGGIRFHTINIDSFTYNTNTNPAEHHFTNKFNSVGSSFLTGHSIHDSPTPTGELYFSLEPDQLNLPNETVFNINYKPINNGFITDLAGNKLNAITNAHSLDRTPPTFSTILSPVNQKQMYVVFSKQLNRNLETLKFKEDADNNIELQDKDYISALKNSLRIIKLNGSSVDEAAKVPVIEDIQIFDKSKKDGTIFTYLVLTLDKEINYDDLKSLYLQLSPSTKSDGSKISTSYDGLTGIATAKVTLIRDIIGNYMQMYSAHAISDFAINLITPLYAYNNEIKNGDESFMYGLYQDGSWAVHDWSRDQHNFGTILANEPAQIVIDSNIPDSIKSLKIYLDNTPDPKSVSKQINHDLNRDFRVWLPKLSPDYILPSLSDVNNESYVTIESTKETKDPSSDPSGSSTSTSKDKIYFDINKSIAESFGTNQQISFLFTVSENGSSPVMIYPSLEVNGVNNYNLSASNQLPLYCLRLTDPLDISSIDLWSYRTQSTTLQRGGVTILNNVINATNGEDTVIKLNVPKSGNVKVMILTLDGNIVKYLHRGNLSAGEYNYYWNGTNNNNNIVARGLYFVRVLGGGIDETRKVMVVH